MVATRIINVICIAYILMHGTPGWGRHSRNTVSVLGLQTKLASF